MSETGAVVEVERVVRASPERAFDAWTDPALLTRWFCGSKADSVEAWTCPRVDGCYLIVMHGEGRDWPHAGHYQAVDRGRRLRFTWYTPSTENQRSDVDVRFEAEDGGTRIRIRHTALPPAMETGFRDGWSELLERLDALGGL